MYRVYLLVADQERHERLGRHVSGATEPLEVAEAGDVYGVLDGGHHMVEVLLDLGRALHLVLLQETVLYTLYTPYCTHLEEVRGDRHQGRLGPRLEPVDGAAGDETRELESSRPELNLLHSGHIVHIVHT